MLQTAFDELFKRLFVPLDAWFASLPPKRRFAYVLLLVAILALYFYRAPIWRGLRIGGKAVAIALSSQNNTFLQRVADTKLPLRITQADSSLQDYIATNGELWVDAWPVGQALLATKGKFSQDTDTAKITAFFNAQRRRPSLLWAQLPTDVEPVHVPATAWAMLGCSRIGVYQETHAISELLDLRLPSGAWPVYPVTRDERFASTYATVVAAAAIHSQLNNPSISLTEKQECQRALGKAKSWLIASRDGPTSQWKDYPNDPTGRCFSGLSGCVLYFLNSIAPEEMHDINRVWLDHIYACPVPKGPLEFDISLIWLETTTHSRRRDIISHYQVPWILAGAAAAFRSGSLYQKAKTLVFLEDSISATGANYPETVVLPWTKAELVIALNAIASMQ